MKTVLVTGFDPFGGESINPAWEVAKSLHEKTIGEYKIISKQVPTVFHKSIQVLKAYIEELSPDIIICIGQAGGRPDVTIERIQLMLMMQELLIMKGTSRWIWPVVKKELLRIGLHFR
ncbi:Pyrrolidone-carboxylate peptidase [Bacillus mycoides]|nr:Pyrrolidone-carboxylate peptidase [Bacillus mycoides]